MLSSHNIQIYFVQLYIIWRSTYIIRRTRSYICTYIKSTFISYALCTFYTMYIYYVKCEKGQTLTLYNIRVGSMEPPLRFIKHVELRPSRQSLTKKIILWKSRAKIVLDILIFWKCDWKIQQFFTISVFVTCSISLVNKEWCLANSSSGSWKKIT